MTEKALVSAGNQGIAELTSAERLLELVQTLPEARDLIASAEALRVFMKKADLGYSSQNRAAAIAIKARRKAGEMVKAIERSVGGRPEKTSKAALPVSTPLQNAMGDLGISKPTVSQWQRLADETTEEEIDQKAAEFTAAQEELTTEACLSQDETDRKDLHKFAQALAPIIGHPSTGVRHLFRMAAEEIAKLPPPEECAKTLPQRLRHDVCIPEYMRTVAWMNRFCDEWQRLEKENK
jgi:hypothetical protein